MSLFVWFINRTVNSHLFWNLIIVEKSNQHITSRKVMTPDSVSKLDENSVTTPIQWVHSVME